MIVFAKSSIVIDVFVPTLKNSWLTLLSIDIIFGSATSSTYTKSLNCKPSPLIFGGNSSLILSKNNFKTPAYSFD